MDWTMLGIILAPIFFIVTIVLAIRLNKKKKPAWAHKTRKVIGLGSDAPPELKMTFAGKPVTDVYRTTFIYFNRGNETIPQEHVTEPIAVHFEGADILREPARLAMSKEANKVSVTQSTKDGDNVVALQFLYLDHNDGVVVEVLHTESRRIRCSGNIMGTDKTKDMGEFIPPSSKQLPIRLAGVIVLAAMVLALITLTVMRYRFGMLEDSNWVGGFFAGFLGVALGMMAAGGNVIGVIKSVRFPAWSVSGKEK